MHLAGPWLSTTRQSRRVKISASKEQQLKTNLVEHNRFLKSHKLPTMTLEEYIDYVYGRKKIKDFKPKSNNLPIKESSNGPVYPSLNTNVKELTGVCAKKEEQVYTGSKLIGIAVMHKSNLVPVFSKEDATELAKMRR
jgi:hypothetical protein